MIHSGRKCVIQMDGQSERFHHAHAGIRALNAFLRSILRVWRIDFCYLFRQTNLSLGLTFEGGKSWVQSGLFCVLSSEPASWLHAWPGRCLSCSFRACFRAGIPPSRSRAPALCFYVSRSAYQFLCYLGSISLYFISIPPFVSVPYPLLCLLI